MSAPAPKGPIRSSLKIEVFPTSDLLDPSRKETLRNLCRLINDSFAAHGHPKDNGDTTPNALFLRKRIMKDEELPGEIGPEALTAICIDETFQEDGDSEKELKVNGQYQRPGKIVATASLKLWKGKVIDLARSIQNTVNDQAQRDPAQSALSEPSDQALSSAEQIISRPSNSSPSAASSSTAWDWEVKLCASTNDPRYRGRGLITHCIDMLVAELRRQQTVMRGSQSTDPRADLPIKLWSTSLEGTGNTEYWIRRGFVKVGEAEVAPAGTWMSTRDITICTLAKVIE